MLDPFTFLTIAGTFVLAGAVKGVIGLGLPTVSLAVLTVAFDLPSAMVLLLVPSFVTNVWQAFAGRHLAAVLHRTWPFLIIATLTVSLGGTALATVELGLLSGLLGLLLVAYGAIGLSGLKMVVSVRHERWLGPVAGMTNGILTGMTGSFVVPGVLYLQAIGLSRDALIQAMGALFTLSTLALGVSLQSNRLLSVEHATVSTLALVPAMFGMWLGQKARSRLSEERFKRVFFIALLGLGVYIVASTHGDVRKWL